MTTQLKLGAKGPLVSELQTLMNAKAGLAKKIEVDGVFGASTSEAVRLFQRKAQLDVDGIVGPETALALGKLGGSSAATLARALGAEAANEAAQDEGGGEPKVLLVVSGKQYVFTRKQHEDFRKQMLATLKRTAVLAARQRVEMARVSWDHFAALNRDQYVVSWFVQLAGPSLPSNAIVMAAESAFDKLESAVNSGDFRQVEGALAAAEKPITDAYKTMWEYQRKVIGRAETWVGGLEFTKGASFAIVGALAAPIAAGAGAGAVAAAAIAGGGPALLESTATELGKGVAGTSKGLGDAATSVLRDVVIGTSVGALLKTARGDKIVKAAGELVLAKLGGKWVARLSSKALQDFVTRALRGGGEKMVESAFEETLKLMTLKTTPAEFIDSFAKAIATGGILAGLDPFMETKFAARVLKNMSASARAKLFGDIKPDKQLEVLKDLFKGPAGKAVEKSLEVALAQAKGSESGEEVGENAAVHFASSAEFRKLEAEIAKRVARGK